MKALDRFLRSRRLAVGLIVVAMVYATLATLVPLGPDESPAVREWAAEHPQAEAIIGPLGLHRPFTSPPFLLAVVLLIGSTFACSLERTRQGLRLHALVRGDSDALVRSTPTFTLTAAPRTREPEAALGDLGLKPTYRDAEGAIRVLSSRGWTALASPAFHWSLVALFVFAAAGQLTRSEGTIAVVQGSTVTDSRDSYLTGLSTGPLFGERFSGLGLGVPGVSMGLVVDGVERGDSPRVRITRGQRVVAEGEVYPNHPLRVGSIVVHRGALGPAAYLTIELPDGQRLERRPLAFTDRGAEGSSSASLQLQASNGRVETIRLETAAGARVVVEIPERGYRSEPIARGERVEQPDGLAIRVDEVTTYASLIVVNDWSVPLIYLAFAVAAIAEALALFAPPRAVVLRQAAPDADTEVWVVRKRLDPAFPERVRAAIGLPDDEHRDEESA